MTEKELREKLSTTTGMREVAEELAQVWWDRIDLDDAEEAYVEMSIVGYTGIMNLSTDDIIELCEEAEMIDEENDDE